MFSQMLFLLVTNGISVLFSFVLSSEINNQSFNFAYSIFLAFVAGIRDGSQAILCR